MCEKDISTNFETNVITDKDLNLMQTISLNKPKKKVSFDNNLRVAYVQSFKEYNKVKSKSQKEKINKCRCTII